MQGFLFFPSRTGSDSCASISRGARLGGDRRGVGPGNGSWGGCRAGRAWGIPQRLRDQILMLCAPLRARGRALHHGPTGICRAVPGACPCSISEPRPSISSVCRVWGWGLCLVAGFGDHCTQQEQAGGCRGIPKHRAGGSGPESHNTQPQLGAQKNAIWLGRAVGRGIRAACWHGGLDFRAGPHPAHHPPSPEL